MRLGIDFDNTIVRYDELFHEIAVEKGLIPPETPPLKEAVRDHLRAAGREDDWTELQGYVYGLRIGEARPFEGVEEFLRSWRRAGHEFLIISHKTKKPYLGPPCDLHDAARGWLEKRGILDGDAAAPAPRVFFELTKNEKLERIGREKCDWFIDDLPEFLVEPGFPAEVKRLLFDPAGRAPEDWSYRRAGSWAEIAELFLGSSEAFPADFDPAVERLLRAVGKEASYSLQPLSGGKNNRVFRLDAGSETLLLKSYCPAEPVARDRLSAEFSFLAFAWDRGLRLQPRPLGFDAGERIALYEYIEGRPATSMDVTPQNLKRFLDFYLALNAARDHPEAVRLPPAAEACFSLAEHLETVNRRLSILSGIPAVSALDEEALAFVRNDLIPAWRELERMILAKRADSTEESPRRLSPSDFGFHNALVNADGAIRFIDFEYAGWDDPAKMVCDFFCQPAIPVPIGYFSSFAEAVARDLPDPPAQIGRFRLLLPVYRVKWCCILLNEFLPSGADRRRFSTGASEWENRKRSQLEKARNFLASLSI